MIKKILNWAADNILFISTLFLLAFIPLYPKIPLIDIRNTWVYVRAEDFVVFLVLGIWTLLLLAGKVTLKTPLTLPILAFWFVGAIATMHGVIVIFPQVANVFPNVAFLVFFRHLEYVSLFFVAYSAMKDKKLLPAIVAVLVITLLAVAAYGFGQRYAGFPAYLTMNEEFAKGVPIQLSQLGRVPSTFAGHYDLAAYLVMILPILTGIFFGVKNLLVRAVLAVSVGLGFVLMFMTVSRVSFVVLLVSILLVLLYLKRRFVFLLAPLLVVAVAAVIYFQPTIVSRFGNTVSTVDVLVNAETGESVGHIEYVKSSYLDDKTVKQRKVANPEQLGYAIEGEIDQIREASPSGEVIFELLPEEIALVRATNVSTGENLPQGTGYINLSLSPVTQRLGNFFYELGPDKLDGKDVEIVMIHGNFIVKRAAAYDLSFTTRFQGGWPNAIDAFERNIFLGSGYGSVTLAVDNNFLRILGETGIVGFAAFMAMFMALFLYVKRALPEVDSPLAKTFVVGFVGGVIGLFLNATLIDVFEASKVAFILWLLTGITVALLSLYTVKRFDVLRELRNAAVSVPAVILYIALGVFTLFSPSLGNYFVADDFTWFRWASEGSGSIINYFTNSEGFFYRPGPKTYFQLMYDAFWLNQVVYHAVSVVLHFVVVALFYLLAKKIFKNALYASLSAFLFIVASGYLEVVYWISATQYLFYGVAALSALHLFILWEEKRKWYFYVGILLSIALATIFHEAGVVVVLLLFAYKLIFLDDLRFRKLLRMPYLLLFSPLVIYILAKFFSGSFWSAGDYSYNLLKLPVNLVGNVIGYVMLGFLGPISLSPYETLRNVGRGEILLSVVFGAVLIAGLYFAVKKIAPKVNPYDRKIILFAISIFIITLLPFLPLGNIAARYSYLATTGIVIILVLVVRNLYQSLVSSGREIAVISIATFLAVFALFHIIQSQQLQKDWHGAGVKSEKFFVAINNSYDNYWSTVPMELHFVNVPVKNGEAWVFPVGLNDALWFAFQNPELTVLTHGSLDEALDAVGGYTSRTVRIFEFEGDNVEEVRRLAPREVIDTLPRQ